MFAKLRSKFIKRGPEFQCLKRTNKNYNVSKDTARIPIFRRIALQLRCLQGSHKNSKVLKNKMINPIFRRIRAKIPTFGLIRAKIPMFGRIQSKFQCLLR